MDGWPGQIVSLLLDTAWRRNKLRRLRSCDSSRFSTGIRDTIPFAQP